MVRAGAVLLAAMLALVSCGGGAAPAPATSAPAAATAAVTPGGAAATSAPATSAVTAAPAPVAGNAVTVEGFAFRPEALQAPVGTTVRWTNNDSTGHTTTSGAPGTPDGKWNGSLSSGADFSFTFAQAGTFAYFCSIHPDMKGTIAVH